MPVSEAQKRAKAKWDMKTIQFLFRFRLKEDSDIIDKLRATPCKTAYLRKLIRADIDADGE